MEIARGDWIPILWISLLNTGGGCYFYFSSIGRLPVQTVAIYGYIEPLSRLSCFPRFFSMKYCSLYKWPTLC